LDKDLLISKLTGFGLSTLHLHSQAATRHKYLKRPDHGRRLSDDSAAYLQDYAGLYDIVIVLADGLSATAINDHAPGLLKELLPKLAASGYKLAPICLAEQARVAIGDDIGGILNARLSLVLIGERPGLSSADSMGAYLTYQPVLGLTDESRNCISNIRPQGLKNKPAAHKIYYLILEAFKRKLSGVALKDNAGLLNH
jgi:ethanolamine ammonia-lyase small subunit